MATGGLFSLIINDGRQDQILMASHFLQNGLNGNNATPSLLELYQLEQTAEQVAIIIEKLKVYNECSICAEEMNVDGESKLFLTKCEHVFHTDCIHAWHKRKNNCPLCRLTL